MAGDAGDACGQRWAAEAADNVLRTVVNQVAEQRQGWGPEAPEGLRYYAWMSMCASASIPCLLLGALVLATPCNEVPR
jgi:hypothetical protein